MKHGSDSVSTLVRQSYQLEKCQLFRIVPNQVSSLENLKSIFLITALFQLLIFIYLITRWVDKTLIFLIFRVWLRKSIFRIPSFSTEYNLVRSLAFYFGYSEGSISDKISRRSHDSVDVVGYHVIVQKVIPQTFVLKILKMLNASFLCLLVCPSQIGPLLLIYRTDKPEFKMLSPYLITSLSSILSSIFRTFRNFSI